MGPWRPCGDLAWDRVPWSPCAVRTYRRSPQNAGHCEQALLPTTVGGRHCSPPCTVGETEAWGCCELPVQGPSLGQRDGPGRQRLSWRQAATGGHREGLGAPVSCLLGRARGTILRDTCSSSLSVFGSAPGTQEVLHNPWSLALF